jgi:uncharacterized membrane protein
MQQKSVAPDYVIRRNKHEEIENGIEHEAVITVMVPPMKVYEFWRDVTNLPLFMEHLKTVEVKNSTKSHWVWKALRGSVEAEWDSEIVHDVPGSKISWRATENSSVSSAGTVTFFELPYNRGTAVHVHLTYHPPGGAVTDFLEKIVGESPHRMMMNDLRRLRCLLETGEIPSIEGQPRGGMEATVNPALYTHH